MGRSLFKNPTLQLEGEDETDDDDDDLHPLFMPAVDLAVEGF